MSAIKHQPILQPGERTGWSIGTPQVVSTFADQYMTTEREGMVRNSGPLASLAKLFSHTVTALWTARQK